MITVDSFHPSWFKKAVETGRSDRTQLDESVRAVVLDGAGDVAPVSRTQSVGVLLQLKSCGGRGPGNNHRIRRRALDGESNRRWVDRRILDRHKIGTTAVGCCSRPT